MGRRVADVVGGTGHSSSLTTSLARVHRCNDVVLGGIVNNVVVVTVSDVDEPARSTRVEVGSLHVAAAPRTGGVVAPRIAMGGVSGSKVLANVRAHESRVLRPAPVSHGSFVV